MKCFKKISALILSVTLSVTLLPFNLFENKAYAASTMQVGDYVEFGSYLGKNIIWRVVNIDSTGSPLLYAENIVTFKDFDAAESGDYHYYYNNKNINEDRQAFGSNNWKTSNLREWLNSSNTRISYSTQAPTKMSVKDGYDAYADEAGFLSNFSKAENNLIKPVTHKSILAEIDKGSNTFGTEGYQYNTSIALSIQNYDKAYYENVTDKVFILDVKELHDYVYNRGTGFNCSKGPTQQAVNQCEEKGTYFSTDYYLPYFLRTPEVKPLSGSTYYCNMVGVSGDGSLDTGNAASLAGVVPAVYLKSGQSKSGTGIKSNPYIPVGTTLRNRISGSNRYETSAQISKAGWKKTCNTAIIATGENFPDALCAAPLAKKNNAPIILTDSASLNSSAKEELQRLTVKNVIIIGGYGAISQSTENSIKSLGISITRIAGIDRYDTSEKIAEKIGKSTNVVLATGGNFPDALSIAPIAAMNGMPILLTEQNEMPSVIKGYFANNKAYIANTYVVGGIGVVSESVKNTLKNSIRLSGINRYTTNIAILNQFKDKLNLSNVYVATGTNFPDALACSALAPMSNSPIVLSDAGSSGSAIGYYNSNISSIDSITTVGGVGVMPESLINSILNN